MITKREDAKKLTTDMLWIALGTFISGSAVFFFMMPSNLAVASISAIAIMLATFIPLKVSVLMMGLNIICLIIGLIFVGREFSGKTLFTSIFQPAVIGLYEALFPDFKSVMGDTFVDLICYLFLVSLGLAIVFNHNASTGGIDIIVKIMNKYLHMEIGRSMSIIGLMISIPAVFVFGAKVGVLSILGSYMGGIVLDHFIFGMNQKKKVCILSSKSDRIGKFIIEDMHSGASLYSCTGAYDLKTHDEIQAIVNRGEYARLMNFIQETDPAAFVTVYNVSEARIRPKPALKKGTPRSASTNDGKPEEKI